MENIISYILCFGWLFPFLMGLLGLLLGWLLFRGKKQVGDLSIEGEGQLRAESDSLRSRITELEGRVVRRDTTITGLESNLAGGSSVAASAASGDDDETYALEWRNRYLAARVKYLEGRITDTPKAKPKKKAVAKKRVVKKVVKKAAPKKKPAPKKKAAPKKNMSIIARGTDKDAIDAYYANARKYDKTVTRKRVEELTKYCGISLRSRDASLVACSQEHERVTIAKGYCAKKLGMNEADGLAAVEAVCKKMKGERFKSRVTFYHLLSKAGKKKAKPAKAAAAKKVTAKKKAPVKKKAPAKKKAAAHPNDKYYKFVRAEDAKASKSVIDNIVKYCGIALKSRDGSLVACTQEHELDTIAKGFATKKLGMKTGQMELVQDTCKAMKSTRMKNRVAFYYVMAKKSGKLGVFK